MQKRRLQAKNKRKTASRLALIALGALVLVGAAIGLVLAFSKSASLSSMEALPFSAEATRLYTGSGFLYLAEGRLNYKDLSDERKNLSLSTTNASDVRLAASKSVYAIYNSSAVQIVGVDFPIEFSGTVQSVKCGVSHVAVYRQDASGNGAIQVYTAKGERTDSIELTGATLVNYGFRSAADDTLWTLTLDTSSATPVQTLTTYDLTKAATTGVITLSGELAENVSFTEKSVFAVCTGNVLRFNRTGNAQAYRVIVYGYAFVDASFTGTRPLFLFVPRESASLSSVMLLAVDEEDVASERRVFLQLPQNALTAVVANGKLLVYCADAVYVYSEKGTLLSSESFETPIEAAVKLDDTHMLLRRGSALYLAPVS